MELRVKNTAREIFLFSMSHFYRSVPGIINVVCMIMALGLSAAVWGSQTGPMRVMLGAALAAALAVQPFVLYRKAAREAADPNRSREIHFKIDYNGLKVSQGKEKASIRWNQVLKVGKVSDIYIIYLTKNRAYLIPGRVLTGEKKEMFLGLIRQYVSTEKRRGIGR